jgi:hypothetical protein
MTQAKTAIKIFTSCSHFISHQTLSPDSFSMIRIQGHKIVVRMSKERAEWVGRNLDVLVLV